MVVAVAMLLAVSAFGAATSVVAPYKGVSQIGYSPSVNGCATASVTKPTWSMTNGSGGLGVQSDSAKTCSKSLPPVGSYSVGSASANLNLAIRLKIPGGAHTVIPSFAETWKASEHVSNGSGCPAPKPFSYGYSYAPPNSSYAYWDNYTGASSGCSAFALMYAYMNVFILDLTNGTTIYPTFAPNCGAYSYLYYCEPFFNSSLSDRLTGWTFYNYTTYSSGSWSYTSGGYSMNSSTASLSLSGVSSGRAVLAPDFNYTFVRTHAYALQFNTAVFSTSTDTGWMRGGAAITINMGTRGNGVTLTGIVIT